MALGRAEDEGMFDESAEDSEVERRSECESEWSDVHYNVDSWVS